MILNWKICAEIGVNRFDDNPLIENKIFIFDFDFQQEQCDCGCDAQFMLVDFH